MSKQNQRKVAKAKKREAALKNRRIRTGSNINPKNMMVQNKCSKGLEVIHRGSVSGSIMTDILNEQETQPIDPNNRKQLIIQIKNNIEKFYKGTPKESAISDLAFLTENIYLTKVMLELAEKEIRAVDDEAQLLIDLNNSLLKETLKGMTAICKDLYKQAVEIKEVLYFVNSVEVPAIKISKDYIEQTDTLFQYVDVGIFQKACRLTISRLGDRDYRGDPDIKYFRIREGYELMRDMLAYEKAKQEGKQFVI
jgi:hypothetical protein|nr:MAG TPA: hypothetical protein [Bacteriophage sp.]